MFQLDLPWLLALLPLPALAWWLLPPYREAQEAIQAPFFDRIARATGETPQAGAVVMRKGLLQRVLAALVWVLVVVAATRPVFVEDPIVKQVSARDLMLVVDLSGSMDTEDFTDEGGNRVSRLDAVKHVVGDFIERRDSDRMGLIVFGSAAYLQAPFSQDHEVVRYLLDETRVPMAGPQTMLGDAIGFGITRFEESDSSNRVMILLTDGNDTGSRMPPDKAAGIAAQHEITIHTIAIGDPTSVGEDALDEDALKEIARVTEGAYFFANDREELSGIYRRLDELEPGLFETLSYRPRRALFVYFLGGAIALVLLFHVVQVGREALRERSAAHAA